MIVEILTLLNVGINCGFQIPQVILLGRQSFADDKKDENGNKKLTPSAKPMPSSSTLSMNTIMIKTTGAYLASFYYFENQVPILSWIHQFSSIIQETMMMYFCSKKEGISLPKFFAKIFLHLSFIYSLVRFTTIVSIGLLCKTLLTSMFKLKVVSSLFVSKDSTSISLSSNFLSLLGNLTIILLNLAQSGLSQIYFNAGVSLSLDLIIISLTIMYASVKKNV